MSNPGREGMNPRAHQVALDCKGFLDDEEGLRLFELARDGRHDEARELYEWFLPLLRLDTGKTFVQKIKLAQERFGIGSARVRGPRLELAGEELAAVEQIIARAKETRPS